MTENPYAPPQAPVDDLDAGVDAAARVRHGHLLHELQLRSIGTLCFVGALFVALALFAPRAADPTTSGALALALVALAVLGYGFRRLRPWVRVPGAVAALVLGVAGFPLGSPIGGWVLYLVLCRKGGTVLARSYAAIVAATPGMKYRRTVGDWLAIGIVVAALAMLLLAALTI